MPVQTAIQVRRGTAASWTSTNPTLAAGEIGFETDTGKFKIGTGSTAWGSLPYTSSSTAVTFNFTATAGQTTFSGADSNGLTLAYTVGNEQVFLNGVMLQRGTDYTATNGTSVVLASGALVSDILVVVAFSSFSITSDIPKSTLSAKGSIVTASAASTPANQAVGNDGDTLLADSSQSTGLRWGANLGFTAGKNKIINGDFGIWQRGTSFTNSNNYTADRWIVDVGGGVPSTTISQQTFTPGAAPVSGYEGQYFYRYAQTATNGATAIELNTRIEDVRTLAGQTATISFWAKSSTSNTLTNVTLRQVFGSGGSASVDTQAVGSLALTTSWQRYSYTVNIPSVSGKTIGTGSYLRPFFSLPITATINFDLWGVQLEAGSVATSFQTATGTLQGELAACQRYYYRQSGSSNNTPFAVGFASSTTNVRTLMPFPTAMRVAPTSVDYSTLGTYDGATQTTITSISLLDSSTTQAQVYATVASGLTQFRPYFIQAKDTSAAYLAVSAEL